MRDDEGGEKESKKGTADDNSRFLYESGAFIARDNGPGDRLRELYIVRERRCHSRTL